MADEKLPHDSAYGYSSSKGRHWYRASLAAFASEKQKGRGEWILLALLVVFAVVGGSFLGFYLQTWVLNPPVQVNGSCPPPAFVQGWDCVKQVCITNTSGQQVCNLQEAGHIIGPSG